MTGERGLSNARVPVLGVVAPSGTGKTTLLRQVIARLAQQGWRVGAVKQARNDFDVDQPGKDSYRLRKAGVERLLLTGVTKSALIVEHPHGDDPRLNELLALLDQSTLDVILVEGFAGQPFAKIELSRAGRAPFHYRHDPWVIALAVEDAASLEVSLPVLNINDPAAVAGFVAEWVKSHA